VEVSARLSVGRRQEFVLTNGEVRKTLGVIRATLEQESARAARIFALSLGSRA
jgi:hypothetical protein